VYLSQSMSPLLCFSPGAVEHGGENRETASTLSVYQTMQRTQTREGDDMGSQMGSLTALSERLSFTSLREAQAIWRVLNGENAQTVSTDLDVPVTILLPWLEESKQIPEPRETEPGIPLAMDPLGDSGQAVFSSS
jgi:hypothetical protein